MCDPVTIGWMMVASTAMTMYSGMEARRDRRAQAKQERKVGEYNARLAENEATRTRNKGIREENKHRRMVAELVSKQTAQAAASGVDVNSGSALALREDTELLGEVDALQIRENFEDQATSLDQQAALGQYASKGRANFYEAQGDQAALNAFASSTGQVASSWYSANSAANTRSNPAPIRESNPYVSAGP